MVTSRLRKYCWDSLVSLPLPDKLEHSIISSWPLLVSLVICLDLDLLTLVYALYMDIKSWSFSCHSGMVDFTLHLWYPLPNLSTACTLSGGTGSVNSRNTFSLEIFQWILAGCLEFEWNTGTLFVQCHDGSSKQHEVRSLNAHYNWVYTWFSNYLDLLTYEIYLESEELFNFSYYHFK